MSERPTANASGKRGWAAPGGSHDKLIRVLKLALPALIGVVLAFLVFSPLEEKQEVSFLLDKNKVERGRGAAAGPPRSIAARTIAAARSCSTRKRALQANSADPIVEIAT